MTLYNELSQSFPDSEMYAKSMSRLLFLKKFFLDSEFEEKEIRLEKKIGDIYKSQEKRKKCKICQSDINESRLLFVKRGISYYICNECGHVNGEFDDPFSYASELAEAALGMAGSNDVVYSDNSEEDRLKRINVIYKPKIEYLMQTLRQCGEEPEKLSYTEVGAGGGHLITAMKDMGLVNSIGLEASKNLVESANKNYGSKVLEHVGDLSLESLCSQINGNVAILIFVLEHITWPREIFEHFSKNENTKYVFFSVPLFNPAVLMDVANDDISGRTTGFSHTHFFTEKSLNWLCKNFNFEIISKWWFGSDSLDLYRTILHKLKKQKQPELLIEMCKQMFEEGLDDIQAAYDKNRLSSEIHLIAKKIHNDNMA